MKRNSRSWPTKDARARGEWDFRAKWKGWDERKYPFQFLEPEDVWLCHCYEFDRTLPRTVEDILEWRRESRAQTLEALLEHYRRTHGGDDIVGNWFYTVWPQWPVHPYLSIDSVVRGRQFDAMWPKEKRRPRTLRWLQIDKLCEALCGDTRRCSELVRHALRHLPDERQLIENGKITTYRKDCRDGKEYAHVVAAFEIDFSLSATRLAKLFENWCREQMRVNGWREKPNRGQNSETDRLRTELKYLGAWRLVQSGLTYKQAVEYTGKVSGQPLFAKPSEWSRAVKAAESLLFQYS